MVENSAGTNDGSPFGVVLLDPARSAEPPHSSGRTGAIAVRISPEALRVATPFGSASYVGSASAQPSGSVRVDIRSKSALPSGFFAAQASYSSCQAACSSRPRSTSDRVWASTSSETSNVWSGSKPRTFLVAATSSSPRAEPCASPVFWALGAGQAMIVRSTIRLGLSVTLSAFSSAFQTASTSSAYSWPSWVQSTVWTCQP